MITVNVSRFIELQTTINKQIVDNGEAEFNLVTELDELGNQLSNDEISVICLMMEADNEDMSYEDVEWELIN
jgi:hypothetical protein